MFDSVTKLVEMLIGNPLQGFIVATLLLFVVLYLNKRKETEQLRTKLNEEKQVFYIELFVFLNKAMKQRIDLSKDSEHEKLIELDSKLKLYARDDVVLAWGDFWQACYNASSDENPTTPKQLMKSIGLLQHAIRKDLRSSSWISSLKWFDFSRSILNDVETILDPKDKGFRTVEMRKTGR